MQLRNGRIEIEIDELSGSIVRLRDGRMGLVHLDAREGGRDDARLFRVMVPRPRHYSRRANSHTQSPPQISKDRSTLTLRWENLVIDGERSGVEVEVLLQPGHEDELHFQMKLRNNGPDDVLDVWFPILGGWTGLGGKGQDTMILGAYTEFDPHGFPIYSLGGTTYACNHQRHTVGYPVYMYAPWVDLSGPGGGISYILYNTEPRNGYIALENEARYDGGPLRLTYGWASQCLIKPGQEWQSAPVGISLHNGDWHETADRYGAWMNTWWQSPPTQPKLREIIGFQNVWLRGFDGEPFRDISTIPDIARAGRKYGVHHLSLWDYIMMGNYCKYDDLDLFDYSPQERAVLCAGLRQAKAEGTNVSALTNWRLTNPTSTLFKNESHREISRGHDGSARTEQYRGTHGFPGALMSPIVKPTTHVCSPHAPTYRARVLRQLREYLEMGFTSCFYDQPFEFADYAHVESGGDPEKTNAATASLIAEVRRIMQDNDAEGYLIGEMGDAFISQHIDLWMSWYPTVEPAIRAAYTLPRTMHSWVVDKDFGQSSHAFALGMYLCLCTRGNEGTLADVPAFGEHVAALARLRRETAPFTAHAKFRHMRGLEVESDGGGVAYFYESDAGPAVIAAAPDGATTVKVSLKDSIENSTPGTIYHLDGRRSENAGATQEWELAAHDVVVWKI